MPADCGSPVRRRGFRIVTVADAYDAMRSNRPYRRALGRDEAIRRLREGAGGQFDPNLIEPFCALAIPEPPQREEPIWQRIVCPSRRGNRRAHMTARTSPPRILVVDDDRVHRGALIDALIFSGFSVAEAATGGEGIDAAAVGDVDAVLLDIGLPDVDGVDLIPKLREAAHSTRLPVVALSGRTLAAERDRALRAGCDAYLTKPPSVRELIGTLSILCLDR